MTEVAFYAESLGHYPNWHHHYNLVKIQLTTHDVNGITSHDIRLAKKCTTSLAPSDWQMKQALIDTYLQAHVLTSTCNDGVG